jgi:hypothetical protein
LDLGLGLSYLLRRRLRTCTVVDGMACRPYKVEGWTRRSCINTHITVLVETAVVSDPAAAALPLSADCSGDQSSNYLLSRLRIREYGELYGLCVLV